MGRRDHNHRAVKHSSDLAACLALGKRLRWINLAKPEDQVDWRGSWDTGCSITRNLILLQKGSNTHNSPIVHLPGGCEIPYRLLLGAVSNFACPAMLSCQALSSSSV